VLQGHAVILTFKVVIQMLHATHRLNMVIISVNSLKIRLQITKLWDGQDFAAKSLCDHAYKVATTMLRSTHGLNMLIIPLK